MWTLTLNFRHRTLHQGLKQKNFREAHHYVFLVALAIKIFVFLETIFTYLLKETLTHQWPYSRVLLDAQTRQFVISNYSCQLNLFCA